MKILCLLILFSRVTLAQTEQVFNTVIENNSNKIISGIKENKIDSNLMDLLLDTIELQNTLDEVVVSADNFCNGDEPKKNKKVKLKTKSVQSLGYELVFLAEANSFRLPKESDLVITTPTAEVKALFNQMHDATDESAMYQILETYIQENNIRDLSLSDQAKFAAMLGDQFLYSDERAAFLPSYNQGAVSTFTQFTADDSALAGICGDIHAAHNELMKKINPSLETYTMSYAVDGGGQHVISYIADPENPERMILTNYSRVESKSTDGVSSLAPTNTSMDDVGERVRFFQFKDGKQDHVATFRNDVGSFLYEMATDEFERSATPNDNRYSKQIIKQTWKKVVTKHKQVIQNGELIKDKQRSYQINNDLIMFRGSTAQNTDLVGILHKRQKLKNIDENGSLKAGEKFGTQGYMSTAVGNIDYDRSFISEEGNDIYDQAKMFKVYFVTGKRYIKRIVEKKGFVFDGFIGHELELGATVKDSREGSGVSTGDGDYSTTTGFRINKNLGLNNKLEFENKVTQHIGLKDQRAIYSFQTDYPDNIKLTTNAFESKLKLKTNLPKGQLNNQVSYVGTKMGGRAAYRVDYTSHSGGNIFVGIATPTQGISKNKVNILPENYTVMRIGGASPDLLKKRPKLDLRVSGAVGYMPTQVNPMLFQTGVKLNFGN